MTLVERRRGLAQVKGDETGKGKVTMREAITYMYENAMKKPMSWLVCLLDVCMDRWMGG